MTKRGGHPVILDIIPALHVPRPHRGIFSYQAEQQLPPGAVVEVSFGKRVALGIVSATSTLAPFQGLKPLLRVLATSALLPETLLRYIAWEAESTVTPIGTILARTLPSWLLKRSVVLSESFPSSKTPGQEKKKESVYAVEEKRFAKYRQAVKKVLRSEGQALLLFPSAAFQEAFLKTSGKEFVSAPHDATKRSQEVWLQIRRGAPLAIVGLRSALRLPFVNLQLIVLDEESSSLWKENRSHPYTDGRIAAKARALFSGSQLLVGGTVPSVDSFSTQTTLKQSLKTTSKENPPVIVDLRLDRPQRGLSKTLTAALQTVGESKEKKRALIFVNRKGIAPALHCADCGFVFTCTTCTAPVAVYSLPLSSQDTGADGYRLRCRHCGQVFLPPLVCPSCRGFRLFPRGAAGERIEEEIARLVPKAWIGRLDTDVAPRASEQKKILQAFEEHEGPAILVTTAMALSRHLPRLDLFALPAFEQLLTVPNFQAEEEAFETLLRFRSRLRSSGVFLVQSWHPKNQVLEALDANDLLHFLKTELEVRKNFGWPPYRRLAKLTFEASDEQAGLTEAGRLAKLLEQIFSKVLQREILGPFPAFIPRIRGKYIYHLLVKWKPKNLLDLRVERALSQRVPTTWDIDVHPLSIL